MLPAAAALSEELDQEWEGGPWRKLLLIVTGSLSGCKTTAVSGQVISSVCKIQCNQGRQWQAFKSSPYNDVKITVSYKQKYVNNFFSGGPDLKQKTIIAYNNQINEHSSR